MTTVTRAMPRIYALISILSRNAVSLVLLLSCTSLAQAQSVSLRNVEVLQERKTQRYFESIRQSPPQMLAFLLRMPKGGDLHNHLSGSVYAESYIQWAAERSLCVSQVTLILSSPPCEQDSGKIPASTALSNPVLYRQLIDAWSMRFWQDSGQNGHDHFFDSFGKFGAATDGQIGWMLAEVVSRAARGRVIYLELMLTPDGGMSRQIGQKVGWDGNLESGLNKLKRHRIADAVVVGVKTLQDAEAQKNQLLKCGTPQADPGCSVTVRYIAQVGRGGPSEEVFAQMVTGFMLANEPNSKVVGLTLVQAEDTLMARQNFRLQMQMLNFLRPLYPQAHITLHAGELAPGLVPPQDMTFHIRESVMTGHAERIGHGVDIMHEDNPYALLRELARRNVLIEICLSSNALILGISHEQHPLTTYIQYGVPVALATDDEGVARSEISREYLRAAQEQGLGYSQLKIMARHSLEYAFVPGKSLWDEAKNFTSVAQCAQDLLEMKLISSSCRQHLANSEKASLQWKLEEEFKTFESLDWGNPSF